MGVIVGSIVGTDVGSYLDGLIVGRFGLALKAFVGIIVGVELG